MCVYVCIYVCDKYMSKSKLCLAATALLNIFSIVWTTTYSTFEILSFIVTGPFFFFFNHFEKTLKLIFHKSFFFSIVLSKLIYM